MRFCAGDSFAGLPPDLAPKGNMTFRYFNKRVKYWKDMVSSNGSFAPGAFSVAKLLQTSSVAQMTQRLDEYVNDGLRTLLVATVELSADAYEAWAAENRPRPFGPLPYQPQPAVATMAADQIA